MREIGGYIELDTYHNRMLHEEAVKLNCGRNALAYLIRTKNIKKILMPKFMCDSCNQVLQDNQVSVEHYSIGLDFKPLLKNRKGDEWLYLVNFYSQLSNDYIHTLGSHLIVDNAQAYFEAPVDGTDTIYTCRKFFGVPDGAILYTDTYIKNLPQDESFRRMNFLLGRYERTASEFYSEYVYNNHLFENQPIKKMSKLTENLLRAIDYKSVSRIRKSNFEYLHEIFKSYNKLNLRVPNGAFMYPLYIDNGDSVRKKLLIDRIYVPTLWPSVFNVCSESEQEYDMAKNILPLPIDQRYGQPEMEYLARMVKKYIK